MGKFEALEGFLSVVYIDTQCLWNDNWANHFLALLFPHTWEPPIVTQSHMRPDDQKAMLSLKLEQKASRKTKSGFSDQEQEVKGTISSLAPIKMLSHDCYGKAGGWEE